VARETIPSLYNAFLGRPLDTGIWENDAFIGGRIRTEGEPACSSANWCTTACAVALYAGRDYARPWWMQYFDQAAFRFMGKEPFSRIYSHWMAFPVMYVGYHAHRRNDTELRDRAHDWLRAFWTYLCIAGVDHDQRNQFINDRSFPSLATSFCGARSFERGDDDQGNKHRGAPYHIDAWVTGCILKRALFGSNFPAGWFEEDFDQLRAMESASYNWSGLTEDERQTLIRILRNQIGAPEIASIKAWIGPYKPLPTFRLIRSASGVTLYMEKLIDTGTSGATAPVYGCYTTPDGQQQWLAPDSGFRPAGELAKTAVSFGTTEVRDGRVSAKRGDGQVFRENTEALKNSIPLPSGAPILDLRFGPAGLEVLVPASQQPTQPIQPTQPTQPTRPTNPTTPSGGGGARISRSEFESLVFSRYTRHLPEGSEARTLLAPLFQCIFLTMDAADGSGNLTFSEDTRRSVVATLENSLAAVRTA
jgi:hypothetical protein